MKTQILKIILADDHILLRDALVPLINSFTYCNVIDVAGNGVELQNSITKKQVPDIVILDLNMPKMDGYETAYWLHENYPLVKVMVLTMYDSEIALIRLLQTGVRGFLKKDIHPEELKNAIFSVADDGYYYSHNTTSKLASLFMKSSNPQKQIEKSLLSPIEIEFLKYASTDLTYKEIANIMKLTPRVIDNYRDSLFEKLDVKSRVGLAIYAVKNGVVTF